MDIPVTAHNFICLGLPPNFNRQLDLHRTFAFEITHGSPGDTVYSRRWQKKKKYVIPFQLAREEGRKRSASGREDTYRKFQCLMHLVRGWKGDGLLVPG